MSHALLLRLFLSPSFFSVHVALKYLMTYYDNIGITYYLTRRLAEVDTYELRDAWCFICHLLVTRPSKSRALECFVIQMSEKSTHLAMFAYLKDLASSKSNVKPFTICQRVLHRCHEIIFGDPSTSASPYSALKLPSRKYLSKLKVKPHLEPAIVGVGCTLMAPGASGLTTVLGPVAVEQGRAEEEVQGLRSLEAKPERGSRPEFVAPNPETEEEDNDDDEGPDANPPIQAKLSQHQEAVVSSQSSSNSKRSRTADAAQTSPALPLRKSVHILRPSDDPFGQLDLSHPASAHTPSQSSPSISTTKSIQRTNSQTTLDYLLRQHDLHAQRQLLQSYYCRSEIQFILSLENICNRLLVVPKPARVSALRAELTSLNHMLPAEVCMPMWCDSSDSPDRPHDPPKPHHRIVRVPPGESVVLNSAERAPFLLLIEVLNGDLDFDPTKRGNRDVLHRIITENRGRGEPPQLLVSTTPQTNANVTDPDPTVGGDVALGTDTIDSPDDNTYANQSPTNGMGIGDDEEEIDLVEQLYGADISVRQAPDILEALPTPAALKNKDLDDKAWSRSSSLPLPPPVAHTNSRGSMSMTPVDSDGRISSPAEAPSLAAQQANGDSRLILSLDEYSERMRTAAIMLAQLNATLMKDTSPRPVNPSNPSEGGGSTTSWPGRLLGSQSTNGDGSGLLTPTLFKLRDSNIVSAVSSRLGLQPSEAAVIRDRIMQEMLSLEEERMERMKETSDSDVYMGFSGQHRSLKTTEDETIIRRELNKVDPSAVVFQESWSAKKSRIRQGSPYGHLAAWDCVSVIVKTGADLRQEQLAVQMIREFERIWKGENCLCWVRYFRILITGGSSGLVETITDAVSIHSIKKAEYARRLNNGRLGHVSLLNHFVVTYGDPSSAKFMRAQHNFAKSLAGYSIVTYLLQIKDRHNGNILLDRDGHLIHIDFGFMLSNSPGNIGFEAAPFKLPFEYIEVLGGLESPAYLEFKQLFHQGFEAARKHCDAVITIVELMQKDSHMPCFAALGEQTVQQLRDRFQPALTGAAATEHVERLIMSSLGSNWTRLYDSYQYYAQSIL